MDPTVDAAALSGTRASSGYWMIDLFVNADLIVKAVIILLFLCSILSWTIILDKLWRISRLNRRADTFEEQFWSGGSLDDLYDRMGAQPGDPMAAMFGAAMREWRRAAARGVATLGTLGANLRDRVDRVMQVTLGREMERIERYTSALATIGSTAPFVGLFGTVWGIMHSFQAIAARGNTSLAVVAPGIAEALFATALGLVAAIPAVVAYNKIANDSARYAGRLDAFAQEFGAILSRQIDDRAPGAQPPTAAQAAD